MKFHQHVADYESVTRKRPRELREDAAAINDAVTADSFSPHAVAFENGNVVRVAERPVPAPVAAATTTTRTTNKQNWVLKRGHTLSYVGLFLFTVTLYFRPYELFSALSSLTSLAYWLAVSTLVIFLPTQFALESNLTTRPREVNLALLLCLAGLLSMPFAINPGEAWDTFSEDFIKAALMFVVTVNVVRTERRLKGLLLIALAVSCMLSVSALSDYRQGHFTVEEYRISGAIGGMFGNPNDLALHLVTMFPIAVALFLTTRNYFLKALYLGCAVLVVIANVITFSRGGFLGLMSVGLVLAWKFGRRNRFSVMALSLTVIVLFVGLAPGNYAARLASIFNSSLDPVGSGSMRGELLKMSTVVALKNPLFGIGMGNFHIVSIREQVSHNAYTQVAAEMGLAAAIVYTMFIIAPLRRLREIERETFTAHDGSYFYFLAVGLQASLIGYMVGSFFASVAYQWYVYYIVGYAVCLRRMYKAKQEAAEAALAIPKNEPRQLSQGIVY